MRLSCLRAEHRECGLAVARAHLAGIVEGAVVIVVEIVAVNGYAIRAEHLSRIQGLNIQHWLRRQLLLDPRFQNGVNRLAIEPRVLLRHHLGK